MSSEYCFPDISNFHEKNTKCEKNTTEIPDICAKSGFYCINLSLPFQIYVKELSKEIVSDVSFFILGLETKASGRHRVDKIWFRDDAPPADNNAEHATSNIPPNTAMDTTNSLTVSSSEVLT